MGSSDKCVSAPVNHEKFQAKVFRITKLDSYIPISLLFHGETKCKTRIHMPIKNIHFMRS